jgi:ethanolamine utilization cobalamin adenosyltransferase
MVRVLTVEEVRRLAKDGVVEVEKGSRFTPLAWDYIHEKALEVREMPIKSPPNRSSSEPSRNRPTAACSTLQDITNNQALSAEKINEVVEEVLRRLSERGIV